MSDLSHWEVLSTYKRLVSDESATKHSLKEAINTYREHIFPTDIVVPDETAHLMVGAEGVFLEKQLAMAELRASMAQLKVSKFEADVRGGVDSSLLETAEHAIECAERAKASDIGDAIDNARDACKTTDILFNMAMGDAFVGLRMSMFKKVQRNIGAVNNYITGAIVPSPPRSFEETLNWLNVKLGQYEDFHLIYPWG